MMKKKGKRNNGHKSGQISSQVFIYILSAVIVTIILIIGYRAISTIMNTGHSINTLEIKQDITGNIEKLSSQYGSVKKVEINLPDKFTEICFVDSMENSEFSQSVKNAEDLEDYFDIKLSVDSDAEANIFLLSEDTVEERFYTDDLDVRKDFECIENDGPVEFWLKGIGKKAELYTQDG